MLLLAAMALAAAVVWASAAEKLSAPAGGHFVPSSDWGDRLSSESYWREKKSGGGSSYGNSWNRAWSAPTSYPEPRIQPSAPSWFGQGWGWGGGAPAKPGQRKGRDDDNGEDSYWTRQGGQGTYRTVCVRLCDGYFWPISFSTTKAGFARDTKACEKSCSSPARLFVHENPGQEPEDMEDMKGQRYKTLKVAFLHRTQYNAACTCKPHPWDEEALARHRAYAEAAEKATDKKGKGKRVETGAAAAKVAALPASGDTKSASVKPAQLAAKATATSVKAPPQSRAASKDAPQGKLLAEAKAVQPEPAGSAAGASAAGQTKRFTPARPEPPMSLGVPPRPPEAKAARSKPIRQPAVVRQRAYSPMPAASAKGPERMSAITPAAAAPGARARIWN
jgi:hypothetical protein